jgi:hypothetical protein
MSSPNNPDQAASLPYSAPTQQQTSQMRLRVVLVVMAAIGLVLALTVRGFRAARESSESLRCENNLRQIGLALQNYHDTFGRFPALWQTDDTGKIAHSWRVAILPFIEANNDFHHYSYSEPWNSASNSKIATRTGFRLYACPADRNHKPGMTNYVAVVGRKTMWPVGGYVREADLINGLSNTIMVVEIGDSDIHWMEPRDLPVEELSNARALAKG